MQELVVVILTGGMEFADSKAWFVQPLRSEWNPYRSAPTIAQLHPRDYLVSLANAELVSLVRLLVGHVNAMSGSAR